MNRKFITGIGNRRRLKEMSDEDLVSHYASGQSDSVIDELFQRYVHLVFGLCIKYLKNEEQARDITMVIFEELGGKIIRFEIKHFKSWLYMVSKNACLMELRKKKHEIIVDENEIIRHTHVEFTESMHLSTEEKTMEDTIILNLSKLNGNQRLCLDMMYLQKKTYKEISVTTGFSIKEVKSYIQNGKRNLRNLLGTKQ